MDNVPKFEKGDVVRRLVARSGKLDAAFSKRLYRITRVKQYKTNRGAGFELEPIAEPGKKEPGLYRAQQLQRVLMHNNKPVQNKLSAADVDALNNLAYTLSKEPDGHEEAEALYRRALAVDPDHVSTLMNLANMLSEELGGRECCTATVTHDL